MSSPPPYRLMTPGPVPLPPEVLDSLAQAMIHHRAPEFSQELSDVWRGLQGFLATSQPVLLMTSTGSGAMEAALTNTLSPGDEILNMESGKFSRRWTQIARAHGLRVHVLQEREGWPLSPQKVHEALSCHPRVKAVTIQACETSTGTANPVFEISQMIRSFPETLLVVDAATAIGVMELKMDEWGLDVVVAGSQKAFMLPTGLGFISLSKRAWGFNERATCPRFYFDLRAEREANERGGTRFSAPVVHIRALHSVMNLLNSAGGQAVRQRCEGLAEVTREAVQEMDLELFSRAPCNSLTAIRVPQGLDGEKLRDHMFESSNIFVAGGRIHSGGGFCDWVTWAISPTGILWPLFGAWEGVCGLWVGRA